ncbi:methyltransferase family protein [Aquimarina algicola]|uniref:Isoprenylcysteine carboxylmethyltransferase family protein n=1 Tax=Aquimarina algicola TaxID=2589995 RepID=A0A504J9H1_9FLAO|nr:isoprenylcysteine carboxylmethyltransferase family protein [Aquimarina algicola]
MKLINNKGKVYVLLQFILFIVYIIPVNDFTIFCYPRLNQLYIITLSFGFIIVIGAIIQLRNQLTPFPEPNQKGKLIQNKFYKISRHPIYTGILLIIYSYAIYTCSLYKILISIALTILFYYKSIYEEKLLANMYSEYSEYKKKVGRFFPKFF